MAHERCKDWKYQCHKTYLKEGPSDMPSDFIGREDQWEFLCEHFESDAFKTLLGKQAEPWGEDYAPPHGVFSYHIHNRGTHNTRRATSNNQSGYMSPKYARNGHFSEKLDVFSFGVLLLEIVNGKKNGSFHHLENSPTLAGWDQLAKEQSKAEALSAEVLQLSARLQQTTQAYNGLAHLYKPVLRNIESSLIKMKQDGPVTVR
ncbi:hypothetical protein ACLB2K_030038 [Fragaria x ananassa]